MIVVYGWLLRRALRILLSKLARPRAVGQMGHDGRNAGRFHWVHQVVSDSQGNLYTGEVDTGKRIQKSVLVHKKNETR